jgi:hypothetical protein
MERNSMLLTLMLWIWRRREDLSNRDGIAWQKNKYIRVSLSNFDFSDRAVSGPLFVDGEVDWFGWIYMG